MKSTTPLVIGLLFTPSLFAQEPFGLTFTCVDVAETSPGPVVWEVSAFGGFRGLREARDIDAADLYVRFVLEQIGAEVHA